jgi:hypothetical protein
MIELAAEIDSHPNTLRDRFDARPAARIQPSRSPAAPADILPVSEHRQLASRRFLSGESRD